MSIITVQKHHRFIVSLFFVDNDLVLRLAQLKSFKEVGTLSSQSELLANSAMLWRRYVHFLTWYTALNGIYLSFVATIIACISTSVLSTIGFLLSQGNWLLQY